MRPDNSKQKSKAIKMIVIGFAGPFVLIFILLVLTAIINFVTKSVGGDQSVDAVRTILNIVLLVLGIFAVTGFLWGPVIGILGIVKLNQLSKSVNQTDTLSSTDSNPAQSVNQQQENNQSGGNDAA